MMTFKSKEDVQGPEDIFAQINARMIAALMFHDQMTDYFDFLGLSGYRQMHEYQYRTESRERRKLNHYYIKHHNRLIPDAFDGNVSEIPNSWMTANRISIGKSTKQKAVEDGFNVYREWERGTKEVYEQYASRLRELGKAADALFVEKLVEDVDNELAALDKILINLVSSGYDMVYIVESQKAIHDKYKGRMEG